MANIYVRSTDGNNADSGATWALAKADLVGAAAIDANGDTIWLSQSHAESTASGTIFPTFAAVNIYCGDDSAEPPTALATTASIQITGTAQYYFIGTLNIYGVHFKNGTGTDSTVMQLNVDGTIENCKFTIGSTVATSIFVTSNSDYARIVNPTFKLAAVLQRIGLGSKSTIYGGSLDAATAVPSSGLFSTGGQNELVGFDFTYVGASNPLIYNGSSGPCSLIGCKLPASWSGELVNTGSSGVATGRISMYNCDSAGTNYRLWIETTFGKIRDETTLVRTGGASDGVTPLSWKMTTSVRPTWNRPLDTDQFVIWNDTTGASKTVTVEILHDSATNLKDDEVWLEVSYLSSSSTPIYSTVNDTKADALATAVDQASSSATWTTTGMGNPNKQKLSVTFTPQMKGYFLAKVRVAKASYTVYVDPKLTVT